MSTFPRPTAPPSSTARITARRTAAEPRDPGPAALSTAALSATTTATAALSATTTATAALAAPAAAGGPGAPGAFGGPGMSAAPTAPSAPTAQAGPRVPRTFLDRVAAWWRTSAVGLWAVVAVMGLFELLVLGRTLVFGGPQENVRPWLAFGLLATLILLGRRRWPLAVIIAAALASAAMDLWGLRGGLAVLTLVALYSLFVIAGTAQRLVGLLVVVAGWTLPLIGMPSSFTPGGILVPYLILLAVVVSAAAISRSRREALEHGDALLAAQAAEHRLLAQRDAARRQARVAAELHDSVGHDLTAIISLTEGLAGTVGDPDVDEAIGTINALAREGLADTRHAVDALSPLPSAAGDAVGPRGWDRLGEPLTTVRATGLSAALTETGRRPEDPRVGALVYTVVREALTNVMRHAAGATRAVVALDHADGATRITVSDDGRAQGAPSAQEDGAPQPGPPEGPLAAPSSGHGLIHLAEALHEAGGTLSAGPVPGGWRLHAVVPHRAGA